MCFFPVFPPADSSLLFLGNTAIVKTYFAPNQQSKAGGGTDRIVPPAKPKACVTAAKMLYCNQQMKHARHGALTANETMCFLTMPVKIPPAPVSSVAKRGSGRNIKQTHSLFQGLTFLPSFATLWFSQASAPPAIWLSRSAASRACQMLADEIILLGLKRRTIWFPLCCLVPAKLMTTKQWNSLTPIFQALSTQPPLCHSH